MNADLQKKLKILTEENDGLLETRGKLKARLSEQQNEIESLTLTLSEIRKVLEPFAKETDNWTSYPGITNYPLLANNDEGSIEKTSLTTDDLWRAKKALSTLPQSIKEKETTGFYCKEPGCKGDH